MANTGSQTWAGKAATRPPTTLAASLAQSRRPNPNLPAAPVPFPAANPARTMVSVQPALTLAGTANALLGMGPVNTRPSDYHRGQIIRTIYFVPNNDPNVPDTDDSIAHTVTAGWVSGKARPFIVLAVTDTHLKCMPMYSSDSQGYENKPERIQWECMYLRHWSDTTNLWDQYTSRNFLMTRPDWKPKLGSYVMWTRSYDVQYEWPIAKLGNLTRESWDRLKVMHEIGYNMRNNNLTNQVSSANEALDAIVVPEEFAVMRRQQLAIKSAAAAEAAAAAAAKTAQAAKQAQTLAAAAAVQRNNNYNTNRNNNYNSNNNSRNDGRGDGGRNGNGNGNGTGGMGGPSWRR